VSSGHFTVQLGDCSTEGVVSVLLVHVDNISSGLISKYDSAVPD
jgi:hypothetical protein